MNTYEIINSIQAKKMKCYFISPHFDDAVFSAGYLIKLLSKTNDVTVINVFTKISSPPYTLSAKKFAYQCGYKDPIKLQEDRTREDAEVLNQLNIKVINFPFTDAQWRKKDDKLSKSLMRILPEFGHNYPIYRLQIKSGIISSRDATLIKELSEELVKIIDLNNDLVLCPLGIGNHVDHILTRNVCSSIFKNIIYWSDYPYVLHSNNVQKEFIAKRKLNEMVLKTDHTEKEKLIKAYPSQIAAISKNTKLSITDESYFL